MSYFKSWRRTKTCCCLEIACDRAIKRCRENSGKGIQIDANERQFSGAYFSSASFFFASDLAGTGMNFGSFARADSQPGARPASPTEA